MFNNKSLMKFPLFFFLFVTSITLLVTSYIYVVAASRQISNTPYYKTSDVQYNDFTTVTQKRQWEQHNIATELLANKKINENFTAQVNNLGIIAVPFDTHNKSINDKIIFRLKEAGKKDWYYQATYDANQIQNNIPFPFGFPVIKNSKNISYAFEIESLAGKSGDSLSLSKTNNYLVKYKFSKTELVKNPYTLVQFLVAKISEQVRLLAVSEIIFVLFSFLSPFVVFMCVYDIYIRKGVNNI